jgi:hypothetical protein
MNRRNTVSVTPAIGAKTVAGEIVTEPIRKAEGTRTCVGRTFLSDNSVAEDDPSELSQNFFTELFYFASEFT